MKKAAALSALVLFLTAGCVTFGRDFPSDPVKLIVNGKTTQEEILASFGQPYQKGIEDGKVSWTYYRVKYRGRENTESKELHIVFDTDGRVESHSFTATLPEE